MLAVGCDRGSPRPAVLLVPPPAAPRAAAGAAADPGFVGVIVAGEWVEIEAKVEGRVQELLVKPGDRVARGAPLARLDVTTTLHELAIARAALVEARRRYGRRRRLARSGAISAEEIDAARRELLQERARVQKLEAARAEASVTAPFAGTVVERHLAPGALAGPGRPILRLLGESDPQVRFAVPEEQAATISAGSKVSVRVGPAAPAGARASRRRRPGGGRLLAHGVRLGRAGAGRARAGAVDGLIARVFLPAAKAER